jgi:hypothetical protein
VDPVRDLRLAATGQQLLALLIGEGKFVSNPTHGIRYLDLTRIGKAEDGKHQGLEIWNRHITTRSNYLARDYGRATPHTLARDGVNTPRTPARSRVASVLHGGIGAGRKPLESL